jgi:hypothetical protein
VRFNFYDVNNVYRGGWHKERVELPSYKAARKEAKLFCQARLKEPGVLRRPKVVAFKTDEPGDAIAKAWVNDDGKVIVS